MNFGAWLEEKARLIGDGPCIYYNDEVISYKHLDLMVNKAANMFVKLGLGKGDKCVVILGNHPDYLYIWFGLARIGAVAACMNRYLRGEGLKYLIDLADSKVVVIDAELESHYEAIESGLTKVEHVVWYPEAPQGRGNDLSFKEVFALAKDDKPPTGDIKEGDAMALIHTGGTTGPPKWCIISHNYYIEIGKHFADFAGFAPTDRVFNPLPLFHINPQGYYVMGALAANASMVMVDRFSASAFWNQVQRYNVTCLVLHVGVVDILKARPYTEEECNHSIRVGFRLDAEFLKRFKIPVSIVGYGSTEAAGLVTMNRYRLPLTPSAESLPRLSNLCGKPRDDISLTIANDEGEELPVGEVGEILVRQKKPHIIFDGYYNAPAKTAEAFRGLWFHTGDLGFLDEEGLLHFVQRKDESIRVRGEWVFISEVEKVIKSHPGVSDCAVVGVEGGIGGDEIKAVIEPKAGERIAPEEILAHCEGKLAYFMIPRYIEFVEEFPRTEVAGRIQKMELKKTGVANAWDREAAGYKIKRD